MTPGAAPRLALTAGLLAAVIAVAGCQQEEVSAQASGMTLASGPVTGADDGKTTGADEARDAKEAVVTLDIEEVGYLFTEGRHRFTQTRRFAEHAGVGVTLTRGRVCVNEGSDCVEGEIKRRIEPGSELVQNDHFVATKKLPDTATVHYWGVDDNGHPLELHAELTLNLPQQ